MDARVSVARTTGLLYLGVAITGLLWQVVLRAYLFDPDDAGATLDNLAQHEGIARVATALELGLVVTQSLTGLWFYRLFRSVDSLAAGALAAFSFVNAIVVLVSAASVAAALELTLDSSPGSQQSVQLMYVLSDQLWVVGELFFGLWLVPMGLLVLRSGWMPAALGWILACGGVGYLLSPFVTYLVDAGAAAGILVVPATVGELWMIGYLLVRGVRREVTPPGS
ncbi:DUF4386 domain-containing protein [Nocardioides aquiterrae]|uniref:DUF4386 domain-containing protein n=1 Tax=Nocardioides aquiterrae TaxID=203799 RepID=A0ABN1UF29_9ACTN